MGFDWVQAVPWVISATSAAFAGYAIRRAVRSDRRDEERRRRELPAKFGIWLERERADVSGRISLMYNNGNPAPVTNVAVHITTPTSEHVTLTADVLAPTTGPRRLDDQTNRLVDTVRTINAGLNRRLPTLDDAVALDLFAAYIAVVSFTDPAGEHWSRDLDGKLDPLSRRGESHLREQKRVLMGQVLNSSAENPADEPEFPDEENSVI